MENFTNNDIICVIDYYKIKEIKDDNIVVTKLDSEDNILIDKNLLNKTTLYSASVFKSEVYNSKTYIINKLLDAGIRPFTVEFTKSDGTKRKLIGRFVKSEPLLGRSIVIDLENEPNEFRQIDHRTIESLILDEVKYYVSSH